MSEKMDFALKKCVTPTFRVSFPNVFRPATFEDNDEPKYNCTMLFDKSVDLKALKIAAKNAIIEKYGSVDKKPAKFRSPFRDGDAERADKDGYENTIFVSASCKNKPGLINAKREPILDEEDFYAGCYARAEIAAFVYENKGNKGVSFTLLNVIKVKDGDKFSGRKDAAEVFADLDLSDEIDLEEDANDDDLFGGDDLGDSSDDDLDFSDLELD